MKLKMEMPRGALEIKRTKLTAEIIGFCTDYKILAESERLKEVKESIEHQLEDAVFVEELINWFIVKTKSRQDIDIDRLIDLIIELEKIRLNLEYKR